MDFHFSSSRAYIFWPLKMVVKIIKILSKDSKEQLTTLKNIIERKNIRLQLNGVQGVSPIWTQPWATFE